MQGPGRETGPVPSAYPTAPEAQYIPMALIAQTDRSNEITLSKVKQATMFNTEIRIQLSDKSPGNFPYHREMFWEQD